MKLTGFGNKLVRRLDHARTVWNGAKEALKAGPTPPSNGSSQAASLQLRSRDLPPPIVPEGAPLPPPQVRVPSSGGQELPPPRPLPPPEMEYTPPAGTTTPLLMDSRPAANPQASTAEPSLSPMERMLRGLATEPTNFSSKMPKPGESKEQYLERMDDQWRVAKFEREFDEAGWQVRQHTSEPKFWARELEGREVAFYSRDEEGKQVAHKGVVEKRPDGDPLMSMRFQMEGSDQIFNANDLDALALKPHEPETAAVGRTFFQRYNDGGWTIREKHIDGTFTDDPKFIPENMAGRDVAFISYDEENRLVEHRGVLEPVGKKGSRSTLFTLQGQDGQFNSNFTYDFAVRPKLPDFGTTR